MAYADIIIFADGWKEARGCKVEYSAAIEYRLRILYENCLFVKLKGGQDENIIR